MNLIVIQIEQIPRLDVYNPDKQGDEGKQDKRNNQISLLHVSFLINQSIGVPDVWSAFPMFTRMYNNDIHYH
ncbi:hypothetical protein J27TS7_47240 [Paenibacillus dendritiformis]|nr:hypothetical protein J27TS7_47240 [Paenibacillus dendritiformis]